MKLSKIVAGSALTALCLSPVAPSYAEDVVTPANGGYSWNTVYAESGGLKEGVTFGVKGSTATISTLRGICVDNFGVGATPSGKDAKVSVARGKFKKVTEVEGGGNVATITVKVVWSSAKRATGWIKVTGMYFENECVGNKTRFKLSHVK